MLGAPEFDPDDMVPMSDIITYAEMSDVEARFHDFSNGTVSLLAREIRYWRNRAEWPEEGE